uniref:SH3 domain-containing protein n=1 Tax=Streptomyces sp. NBC_00093 TaxID=2975649 RepID=A0AAU2ABX6_9ACTN
MISRHHAQRALAAASLGLAVAVGVLATASTAQAYDTGTTKISCSAVKVRKSPSTTAGAVGVAYRNDRISYDQWVYRSATKTWWTRGTVTRKSDGRKLRGYVIYQCANPYGTNGAPTPSIPK